MSPVRRHPSLPNHVGAAVTRVRVTTGTRLREERLRRRWTLRKLADATGLATSEVHNVESGLRVSMESYCRIADALGLRVDIEISDPRSRAARTPRDADAVHAAMGDFEAARMMSFGLRTGIDEPYQHFQFAGRADVVAWDVASRALLHIENRTRFPNIQEAAGSWNGKRSYLPAVLAERVGISSWASVTNVMAAIWTSEVLHAVRLRAATFRALCPDGPECFAAWWEGSRVETGVRSTFVLVDPLAAGRERVFVGLEAAMSVKPRHRGYADIAAKLRSNGSRRAD
jgi:transcriptional regulator with XRE-family HTH domain